MNLVVTGSTGFVGKVVQRMMPCTPLEIDGQVPDIRDKSALRAALSLLKPDSVLHLAAQSFVPESITDPLGTFQVNFLGTFNLLQGLKELGFRGRVLFVGTGDVYGGFSPDKLPLMEDQSLRPRNPYAVSKVAAEALCVQWSQTEEFEIVIARPFNHIGPGQSERFAVSDFGKQIIEIKRHRRKPVLSVGDIDVTRDFTDVHDVARAYQLLLARGKNGEIYNVCSGVECSLRLLLERMLLLAEVEAEIVQDVGRFRFAEQRRVVGSFRKLANDTGWEPTIALDDSLKSILEYWNREIQ